MKIFLAIIVGIAVYISIGGKFMLNLAKKLSDILTSDDTLEILRIIIYSCLFLLGAIFLSVLTPLVIYVIISEYIKYGEVFSWRAE